MKWLEEAIAEVKAMERERAASAKAFYNDNNGSHRAIVIRSAAQELIHRVDKLIVAQ